MFVGLFASLLGTFFGWMMALLSIFLILLVLVQRGRGGGLTGALGGPGGQSAFGSKAGDTFTRITFGVAGVWIVLCALAMFSLGNARTAYIEEDDVLGIGGMDSDGQTMTVPPADSGNSVPAGGTGINLGGLDALNNLNPPAEDVPTAPAGAEVSPPATEAETPADSDEGAVTSGEPAADAPTSGDGN